MKNIGYAKLERERGGAGGVGVVGCWWVGNKVHYGKCKVAY